MANRNYMAKAGQLRKKGSTFVGISLIILSTTAVASFLNYYAHQQLAIALPVLVFFGITKDFEVHWTDFTMGLVIAYFAALACAGTYYLGGYWYGVAFLTVLGGMWLSREKA
ncbi:MAG: hypothetical protein ACREF5_02090 [Candidatus Saccharimonadales bacterium]